MIEVKNDWTWISAHVNESLEDESLMDKVNSFMAEQRINLDRVKELYHDGINEGSENGKYLSFPDWFNLYTTD